MKHTSGRTPAKAAVKDDHDGASPRRAEALGEFVHWDRRFVQRIELNVMRDELMGRRTVPGEKEQRRVVRTSGAEGFVEGLPDPRRRSFLIEQ
ncbi:hypothetical protein RxyAA322_13240 [Rubrobacter xylanophilus]|uniref:Uncharacterized protein n=1 Tax=Rubrobacter xylanophilus TaxID=49319 RepID=A0A510HHK4_9ACTN|nr:hypothetical protein RxyAA322_13240 [Rubrobacter xylanophilus]